MARLTRAESQAQTRAQLLETARQLFFADGYHATTLEKVADAAGFSKGAVYSNFRNKDELCAAVLDEVRAENIAEVLELTAAADSGDRLDLFRAWAQRVIGDPGWTTLEAEFAAHARRDDALRGELAARIDGVVSMLVAGVSTLDDVQPQLPTRELATVVLAAGVGLGMFRAIDPTVPVDGLVDILGMLIGRPAPARPAS
ncbi:TetR/AcrR family transcriptional regulator [Nocardia stercoris]|uniref:TetR/AcrR family transcriptional regulator n=1 Tax=Nocardia stercoris TaxID=2483361 RepID=A0A3M2LGQ1_9NOCA|nr:TetR/AcrR family transcriptional regulator [Nocardia stercoris]RMI35793.1 TetR/AcrR family transcriptional regulator [Nocardia stercoris]